MELKDLSGILQLCTNNIHKLNVNLSNYQCEVDSVYQAIRKNWGHVDSIDRTIVALHDGLLHSVSEINESVIKLNLRINLNKPAVLQGKSEPRSGQSRELFQLEKNDCGIAVRDISQYSNQPSSIQKEQSHLGSSLFNLALPCNSEAKIEQSKLSLELEKNKIVVGSHNQDVNELCSTPKDPPALLDNIRSNVQQRNESLEQKNDTHEQGVVVGDNEPDSNESYSIRKDVSHLRSNLNSQAVSPDMSKAKIEQSKESLELKKDKSVQGMIVGDNTQHSNEICSIRKGPRHLENNLNKEAISPDNRDAKTKQSKESLEKINNANDQGIVVENNKPDSNESYSIWKDSSHLGSILNNQAILPDNSQLKTKQGKESLELKRGRNLQGMLVTDNVPDPNDSCSIRKDHLRSKLNNQDISTDNSDAASLKLVYPTKESGIVVGDNEQDSKEQSSTQKNTSYETQLFSYTSQAASTSSESEKTQCSIEPTFTTSDEYIAPIQHKSPVANNTIVEQKKSPKLAETPVALPILPLAPRNRLLLHPNGGSQMSALEVYEEQAKNLKAFGVNMVVKATVTHLNIAENCFFVVRWATESLPIQTLLTAQLPLQELAQFPDFGDIFAVYDSQENIIPRVVLSAYASGGGYDAYLIDYGEHIHLTGKEIIFALPEHIAALPAEAVKCHLFNFDVTHMSQYTYKEVFLEVMDNNNIDLVVKLLSKAEADKKEQKLCNNNFGLHKTKVSFEKITKDVKPDDNIAEQNQLETARQDGCVGTVALKDSNSKHSNINENSEGNSTVIRYLPEAETSEENASWEKEEEMDEPRQTNEKSDQKLSETDWALLNENDEGTSDAVVAVMGYRPTDDQRICRFYDPKIKGCFKGKNCRLLHQPLAPYGATKDVELTAPLLDLSFMTPPPINALLSDDQTSILITYINTPTHFYAQFVDDTPPLLWSEEEVNEMQLTFERSPHLLDVVLALYSDGNYYRAQIIEEPNTEGLYKIFFVDYGNTELVPLSSLSRCNEAIGLKPHKAESCIIEGIKRENLLPHAKTVECVEFLKSQLLNVELDVKLVRRVNDDYIIKFLANYAQIPDELIKRKYVESLTY